MVRDGLRCGIRGRTVVIKILGKADAAVGAWVAKRSGDGEFNPGQARAIGAVNEERILAGVIIDNYNGRSCQMHCAAEPGCQWMTRAGLWFAFAYPFLQLHVEKLICPVGSGNKAARRLVEHLGFKLEAALKDAHPDGDLLMYTMTKQGCRWLNIKVSDFRHKVALHVESQAAEGA